MNEATKVNHPTWTLIVGVSFLAISLLFFMGLVIIATLLGKQVPADSRFLVVVVLAITSGSASGFLGGYARAHGKLKIPYLEDPLNVGLTGGLAALFIVLITGYLLYVKPSQEITTAERSVLSGNLESRLRALEEKGLGADKTLTFEDEELLTQERLQSPIVNKVAPQSESYWAVGSTLTVGFLDGDDAVKNLVKRVVSEWSKHANINLSFDSPSPTIRISFKSPGSWSYIGTQALIVPTMEPTMNIDKRILTGATSENEKRRAILHEFGHVLGFIHEHQNPNATIPWDWNTIYATAGGPPMYWSRETIDKNLKVESNPDPYYRRKPYDPKSIMMYSFPKEWLEKPIDAAVNGTLSAGDISFARSLYPGRGDG